MSDAVEVSDAVDDSEINVEENLASLGRRDSSGRHSIFNKDFIYN